MDGPRTLFSICCIVAILIAHSKGGFLELIALLMLMLLGNVAISCMVIERTIKNTVRRETMDNPAMPMAVCSEDHLFHTWKVGSLTLTCTRCWTSTARTDIHETRKQAKRKVIPALRADIRSKVRHANA